MITFFWTNFYLSFSSAPWLRWNPEKHSIMCSVSWESRCRFYQVYIYLLKTYYRSNHSWCLPPWRLILVTDMWLLIPSRVFNLGSPLPSDAVSSLHRLSHCTKWLLTLQDVTSTLWQFLLLILLCVSSHSLHQWSQVRGLA